jgi:hypothetical protein
MTSFVKEMLEKYPPKPDKVDLSVRVEKPVFDELDRRLWRMKMDGHRITKGELVQQAIVDYLRSTTPTE